MKGSSFTGAHVAWTLVVGKMEYGFTSFHSFLSKNGVVVGNAVNTSGGGGSLSEDSGSLTIKHPGVVLKLVCQGLAEVFLVVQMLE